MGETANDETQQEEAIANIYIFRLLIPAGDSVSTFDVTDAPFVERPSQRRQRIAAAVSHREAVLRPSYRADS